MAWNTPITWVLNQLVSATDMNEQVRDNLNILKTPINNSGHLRFVDATVLTLLSGAATVTQNYHTIAAETGTADDLATLTAGTDVAAGHVLAIKADAGDTITVLDGTGNIATADGKDVTLTGSGVMTLLYDGASWLVIASPVAAEGQVLTGGVVNLESGTSPAYGGMAAVRDGEVTQTDSGEVRVPVAGTMSRLYARASSASGSITVTFRKNGANDTTLQVTMGNTVTEGEDTVGSVTMAAGDRWNVEFTADGSVPADTRVGVSVLFTPS